MPLAIGFEGLSWFGADKPRAIVARIKPTAPLIELQSDHERRLRRIGLAPETRNFTPHVTLARLRSASPAAVADYLGARGALVAPPFEAARFVLYLGARLRRRRPLRRRGGLSLAVRNLGIGKRKLEPKRFAGLAADDKIFR